MAKFNTYYVWIEGKPGVPPHKLPEEIKKYESKGFTIGRGCGTLGTALSWLRDYVSEGFVVRIYGARD